MSRQRCLLLRLAHNPQKVHEGHAPLRSMHSGHHKIFKGNLHSVICDNQQHHHPVQNLGQTEGSRDTETATLNHHPPNPACPQGLAVAVGWLTDSMTNARRLLYTFPSTI